MHTIQDADGHADAAAGALGRRAGPEEDRTAGALRGGARLEGSGGDEANDGEEGAECGNRNCNGYCVAKGEGLGENGLDCSRVCGGDDYPDFLSWMKGNNKVIVFNKNIEKSKTLVLNSDLIFCLDFNSLERIFDLGEIIEKSSAKKILIDHHPDPQKFYNHSLHSSKASSTCELIFDFINLIGEREIIDKNIAECLYAGIMADTGSFKFSSTSSKVHIIVADLIDRGADITKIHRLIYH